MRLKEIRTSQGVKQVIMCKDLGVTQSTISGWENGKINMSAEDARRVADYLEVSVDYLLGRTESNIAGGYQPDAIVQFEVLGRVAGGYGGAVEEFGTGEKITIASDMLNGRPASDFFVLQVRGNSMSPKILDGDKVLVLRTESVDSGTTAVVLYNGDEATIKRVFFENNDWVDLVPNNPEYEKRRIFADECDKFRILGKAVSLIREI